MKFRMDKGQRIAAAFGVIAFLAGSIGFILGRWDQFSPQVQAATVSGSFTILTAVVGIVILSWQLQRQGENAIAANRENEGSKLKKEVYEEVIGVCKGAQDAILKVSGYIRDFDMGITSWRSVQSVGIQPTTPKARAAEIAKLYSDAGEKVVSAIALTERWQIIDARFEIFRPAFHIAREYQLIAWMRYFQAALRSMPHTTPEGVTLPWQPPGPVEEKELMESASQLQDALSLTGCYIGDLQTEMQNVLLGQLFQSRVPARRAPDPRYRAIELDRFDALMAEFEQHEHYGGMKRKYEAMVQERLREQAAIQASALGSQRD